MESRISIHRDRRGREWQTVEEPLDLVGALEKHAGHDRFVLVDCLTLWITNLMMAEQNIAAETETLIAALSPLSGPVVFVSNEVGLGIVPENQMAREFRDHAGFLHQAVASVADEVYFLAAGLPLKMKG
jgi:adenosylcobinamide kinase/adenosylcobinamide-phosphate guanylyltransferase